MSKEKQNQEAPEVAKPEEKNATQPSENTMPEEHGGPEGPEPTRYGDWEVKGICSDF